MRSWRPRIRNGSGLCGWSPTEAAARGTNASSSAKVRNSAGIDTVKIRRLRERAQIEDCGELAIHNGLALRADVAQVISRSLNAGRRVGAGRSRSVIEQRSTTR